LHLHSSCSDGVLPPEELVQRCAQVGLAAIALTDHDEVAGVARAMAEGSKLGLAVVPGIEISCADAELDVHILGLFIDPEDPGVRSYVRWYHEERLNRGRRIVERLAALGMPLDFRDLSRRVGKGALGRPHIADALVEAGYVASVEEAFEKYIGDGKPAFVPKRKLTPADAVDLIHRAGGLAILAHPGDGLTEGQIEQAISLGVDGLEVIHPRHDPETVRRMEAIAERHALLKTGGSDFHGREDLELLGQLCVSWEVYEQVLRAHAERLRRTVASR